MTKSELKAILKKYGFTAIAPSWFFGEPYEESVLFNAYDNAGTPHMFFVNWGKRYARRTMLSSIVIHDPVDVTYMFFKEA